jgi:lipooligosaccharide transport system permease protein
MGAIPLAAAPAIFALAPLTGLLFAALGMIYTALVPVIDFYSFYYTLFITPLFMFSGIFFPLEELPPWVQRGAWLSPLFHGVRAANEISLGRAGAGTLGAVAWLVVVSAVALALAIALMKRRLVK